MANTTIAPPDGFVLDNQSQDSSNNNQASSISSATPPPPDGFVLDQQQPQNNQNNNGMDFSKVAPLQDNFQNSQQSSLMPQQSQLNFGDHAKMSFMDTQGQEDYLKSKYKYVESDGKGNFLYGDSPSTLTPVNQQGINNDFVSKLGNMASAIPSIAGQVALTVGTDGLALPALAVRAALGSGGGQILSGLIGGAEQKRIDPEKVATDSIISAGFGAAGTAAGEVLSGTAKAIAKKAGSALDNYRTGLVLGGKNPNTFDASVATVLHMMTGLDKKTISTGQSLGWKNVLDSPEASDVHGIATIAGDVSKGVSDKETELGQAVDKATGSLVSDTSDKTIDNSGNLIAGNSKNSGKVINTSSIQSRLLEDLSNAGILNKNESMASQYGINMSRASSQSSKVNPNDTYSINENSPLNTKFFQKFLGQLGVDGRNGVFQMNPEASSQMMSVADALKTKQSFQAIVNQGKSITPLEANIAKRALYGNIEEGVSGISDQLSKVAGKVGNTAYTDANGQYTKFMQLTSTLKKAGMDVDNPFNSQNFLSHVNNASPLSAPLLQQLDKTLGNNFLQRSQAWGVNQKISNISPNFLRLGMVASLFGAGILDPDAGGKGGKIALAGLLGTPTGMKLLLKGAGGGYGSLLNNLGGAATGVSKGAASKSAQAILANLVKNKLSGR
jgi:hypothetical protein